MIVYDITNRESFENIKKWVLEVRSLTEPNTVLILVGNKTDLCEKDPSMRKVLKNEAETYALDSNLLFVEASAEGCNNVREAFEILLQKIYSITKDVKSEGIDITKMEMTQAMSQSKCC